MRARTTSTTSWSASWRAATRARSARCSGGALSRARRLLLLLALAGLPAAARADYWVQATPQDPAEQALRNAVAIKEPVARIAALKGVAASHPGTAAAGLAHLELALGAIDSGRFSEAEAALKEPDLKRTALEDRAQFSLARAREGAGHNEAAARIYEGILESFPETPLRCDVLSRAADAWARTDQRGRSAPLLQKVLDSCAGWEPSALLRLGQFHESRGQLQQAADYYDRVDCDYPESPRSMEAAKRLAALKGKVSPLPPAVRFERDLRKAVAFSDAGRHREAAPLLRSLLSRTPPSVADGEIVRMRLARALVALDKETEALSLLQAISPTSVFAAEAAFLRARARVQKEKRPWAWETVVSSYPGTEWAEEALLNLAQHYLKDARYAEAVPYFQRMLNGHPDGKYLERASWWSGWWEYLSGRLPGAAAIFENVAAKRPDSLSTGGALYWAARAHQRLGNADKAEELFRATVRGFKHTYHGLRAGEELGVLRAGASTTHPAPTARGDGSGDVPEPQRTRARELMLIERYEETVAELERVSASPEAQATVAWIHWKHGRLRPAITAMRRAYPDWRSEAGDRLPLEVWRILYPINYEESLVARAGGEGLDPALMAALIWQESAFDPGALSAVGARGLMQLMPTTGRSLARSVGAGNIRPQDLNDPARNLQLGALYLRQMIGRFGGRLERALAAYNAGPTRVNRWTAARRDMPAEEFIENVPFSETRTYVMNILAHREHYRRLYSLPDPEQARALVASGVLTPPTPRPVAVAEAKKPAPRKTAVARKAKAGSKTAARKAPAKRSQARKAASSKATARKPARKRNRR